MMKIMKEEKRRNERKKEIRNMKYKNEVILKGEI